MCKYCIETNLTLNYLAHLDPPVQRDLDQHTLPFFLQESHAPLIKVFARSPHIADERFQRLIAIPFCRIWEALLQDRQGRYGGFQAITPFLDARYALERYYRQNVLDGFLSRLRDVDLPGLAQLGEPQIYRDTACWEALMANTDQLLFESNRMLNRYCSGWLDDREAETSDPTQQKSNATDTLDPLEHSTPKD